MQQRMLFLGGLLVAFGALMPTLLGGVWWVSANLSSVEKLHTRLHRFPDSAVALFVPSPASPQIFPLWMKSVVPPLPTPPAHIVPHAYILFKHAQEQSLIGMGENRDHTPVFFGGIEEDRQMLVRLLQTHTLSDLPFLITPHISSPTLFVRGAFLAQTYTFPSLSENSSWISLFWTSTDTTTAFSLHLPFLPRWSHRVVRVLPSSLPHVHIALDGIPGDVLSWNAFPSVVHEWAQGVGLASFFENLLPLFHNASVSLVFLDDKEGHAGTFLVSILPSADMAHVRSTLHNLFTDRLRSLYAVDEKVRLPSGVSFVHRVPQDTTSLLEEQEEQGQFEMYAPCLFTTRTFSSVKGCNTLRTSSKENPRETEDGVALFDNTLFVLGTDRDMARTLFRTIKEAQKPMEGTAFFFNEQNFVNASWAFLLLSHASSDIQHLLKTLEHVQGTGFARGQEYIFQGTLSFSHSGLENP